MCPCMSYVCDAWGGTIEWRVHAMLSVGENRSLGVVLVPRHIPVFCVVTRGGLCHFSVAVPALVVLYLIVYTEHGGLTSACA